MHSHCAVAASTAVRLPPAQAAISASAGVSTPERIRLYWLVVSPYRCAWQGHRHHKSHAEGTCIPGGRVLAHVRLAAQGEREQAEGALYLPGGENCPRKNVLMGCGCTCRASVYTRGGGLLCWLVSTPGGST